MGRVGIVGELTWFEVVTLHGEILRKKGNALSKGFVYSSISNVELQSSIYRRLALISLAHMA